MNEALAVQPDLWPEWPNDPLLVERIRERSFLRTGKIIGKHMERCRAVCLDVVYGRATGLLSDRAIAQKHRISRNDLQVVIDIMDVRGELEPLTKAINAQLDMNTWLAGMRIQEGLLSGDIHPGQLPIAWCAMFDKKAQRDAGMVVGTERTVAGVTAEQLAIELAMVRRHLRAPSDSRADDLPTKQAQISAVSTPDTGMDTGKGSPEAVLVPSAAQVEEAGGGDQALAGGPDGRGLTSEICPP